MSHPRALLELSQAEVEYLTKLSPSTDPRATLRALLAHLERCGDSGAWDARAVEALALSGETLASGRPGFRQKGYTPADYREALATSDSVADAAAKLGVAAATVYTQARRHGIALP